MYAYRIPSWKRLAGVVLLAIWVGIGPLIAKNSDESSIVDGVEQLQLDSSLWRQVDLEAIDVTQDSKLRIEHRDAHSDAGDASIQVGQKAWSTSIKAIVLAASDFQGFEISAQDNSVFFQPPRKRNAWSTWISWVFPLNEIIAEERYARPINVAAAVQYRPSAWFFQIEMYKYLKQGSQRIWDPDFSYQFGIQDNRKNNFSFNYYNGGRNRFNAENAISSGRFSNVRVTHLEEGTITLKYNVPLFKTLPNWLALSKTSSFGSQLVLQTTPRVDFWDGSQWDSIKMHRIGSLYAYYNLNKIFYVSGNLLYYPQGHQLIWHADYNYQFGLSYWRSNKERILFEYANYSSFNQFGRSDITRKSDFYDGRIYMSFYWDF